MTSPLIDIRDLRLATSATPSRELLKGLSLTLRAGEVLGIIGESGAGKSTLGLAALGHLRAGVRHAGGQVLYRGQDLLAMPLAQRNRLLGRKLTYVAQSASAAFNPAYTLGRQMTETLVRDGMPREAARQRMVALLRKLDLPDPEHFGERYPHQVSGGQLQRAMTVMAMVSEPEMVVFDEPTTALDVTTQLEVLAAIKKAIQGQQSAALYISHDLAVVSQICDRIMVLRHGELVEAGPARQVVDDPARGYTRELLAVSRHRGAPEPVSQEDAILSVDGLSLSYGPVQVLHDVSLRLRRGTTLAVVGESGSGKSTLAKTIVGLVPGPRQTLRFDGQVLPAALRERSRDTLRRIQLVFQTPDTALNPRLTIGESLGRPVAFYHGLPAPAVARRVDELLAEIELPAEVARRYPGELSGGQKQRVCIARALAAQPDVIICDEVTSALDPLVAQGIIALLARLQRQRGVSYIFITHDLGTVQSIAHDIAVMRGGKVVDSGRRDDVLPPRHPYTRLLFGAEPRTEAGWLEQALRGRSRGEAGVSGELQKAVPDAPMSIG
ncbi:ABC transporter ATP-binding protein [Bordetella hinzii]|uniref:ABC transporter ATP-binding protein n=1 Tax=Bordetella hinzii TaxID=103855 RepID=A0AAN1S1C1_9BORD|nr:ABC transporter ATP-binding protein [Bordetella hinzii]AKQ59530.1 Glutathione import ATP-binding protein GsiA [Bordetella hinzii]AZW19327.1 ABC transporter ATP-binding protein [Bordetella hinzii]KCB44767.1 ABC transporter, ATP-binding protein [Bordetella hinzii 4161]KXA73363.1 ABC transporter [Bordetella hinzii LMG 13501]MBZ0073773.1 ABC transporter ATP-binding protein [Bordetella hinzii]